MERGGVKVMGGVGEGSYLNSVVTVGFFEEVFCEERLEW